VFSFGVLHHTGDTRRAVREVGALVGPGGLYFLYLYGRRSVSAANRTALLALRTLLAPLPFRAKHALLRLWPGRDPHQAFDLFSPLVNDRHDHDEVAGWLRDDGFAHVDRTIDHSEIFVRAHRGTTAPLLPPPTRPYWFERHAGR
jgi:SAM-dependent methyltransferase